jgi:hypothetical protein
MILYRRNPIEPSADLMHNISTLLGAMCDPKEGIAASFKILKKNYKDLSKAVYLDPRDSYLRSKLYKLDDSLLEIEMLLEDVWQNLRQSDLRGIKRRIRNLAHISHKTTLDRKQR